MEWVGWEMVIFAGKLQEASKPICVRAWPRKSKRRPCWPHVKNRPSVGLVVTGYQAWVQTFERTLNDESSSRVITNGVEARSLGVLLLSVTGSAVGAKS